MLPPPLLSTLLLLATTTAVVTSAALTAAALRVRGLTAFCLAVYVLAFAEVVLLTAALSVGHGVTRGHMVVAVAVLLAIALAAWLSTGHNRFPAVRPAVRAFARELRDPPLAVLAFAVALGLAYVAALAVLTPPNSGDALWYHLSRAAFWKQDHAVGYIAHPNDGRLNGNPPVAEIAILFTMVVAAGDRWVTLVALTAYLTTCTAVFGIARRVGATTSAAMTAGFLFATLPVPVLQASGALNDLVIASFFSICVYFCLDRAVSSVALAGLALVLAVGTKVYGVLLVPLVALILLASRRWRPRHLVILAGVVAAVGSAWFVVNTIRTGSPLGTLESNARGNFTRGATGPAVAAITARHLIGFAEVPGAQGWWLGCYVISALAALILLLRARPARNALLAGAAVLAAPFLIVLLQPVASRAYEYVLFHLGYPALGVLDHGRGRFAATPMQSYYGPLGVVILCTVLWLRRPRVAVVLAAAPLLFALELGLTVGFGPLNGRFFAGTMAVALAAFGLALDRRSLRWAVAALAVPTLALTLRANTEKAPSIWGESRVQIQTHSSPDSGERRLIEFVDSRLPGHASIGLALDPNDVSYPFFGEKLQRHVVFVPSTAEVPPGVQWLALAPDKAAPPGSWRLVVHTADGYRLYRG